MTALRILIADDERDLALGVADLLETEGHHATLAHRGETTLDLARERTFDMIFLDVKLPGLSGIEILGDLRLAQPEVRIVLMTGYRIDNLLAEAAGGGGQAVLRGTLDGPRLAALLREVGPGGIVLVVEEEEKLGARLEGCLSERGVVAHRARTEDEALEHAAAAGLDVLILDLGVPIARAMEICLATQKPARDLTAIIVASALRNGKSFVNPLRSVSVTGCLFKPFDPEDLLRVVRGEAAILAGLREAAGGPT